MAVLAHYVGYQHLTNQDREFAGRDRRCGTVNVIRDLGAVEFPGAQGAAADGP